MDPKTYVIGPEDLLVVRVWREAELSGEFPVRPDGRISLPLVNEIQAAGLTPEQLKAAVEKGLSRYMTQPEVSVAVRQVNSKKYFIIGEVQKPGSYPLTVPTSVLEALVNAGGFRDFANPKKIVILRGGERLKFNYKEVISGKKMDQNIRLESGDQIIVP
ncbi:MAG TPA: polysaccharide biosynthesis/export family protein [Bryobacteraceae bacterium]|nr:polysaccharide biosynthesis/export family protein [Bryobacteraceae bacterium]